MIIRFNSYAELFDKIDRLGPSKERHQLQGMGSTGEAVITGYLSPVRPQGIKSHIVSDNMNFRVITPVPEAPQSMWITLAGHFALDRLLYVNFKQITETSSCGALARMAFNTDAVLVRDREPASAQTAWRQHHWWLAGLLAECRPPTQPPKPTMDALQEISSLWSPRQANILNKRLKGIL